MTLLEEIQAKCSPELIASKEHGEIARVVSVGRTKIVERLGGVGTVISVLKIAVAAPILDALQALGATNRGVFWGFFLLERDKLDFGDPETREILDDLVAADVLPFDVVETLKALAVVPDPVSVEAVVHAMEGL